MDKFDRIGEAVLSALIGGVFAIECARFYVAGKASFLLFLPIAWIFLSIAWDNVKALKK